MKYTRTALSSLLIVAALVLGGCENANEKAESKYQNALELIENGDFERAIVELKGVFQLNGEHQEARLVYADLMLDTDKVNEAFAQYKLAAQQYPNDIRPRIAQAEIAIKYGEWDEVDRNLAAMTRIDPENPRVKAVGLAMEYRDVVQGDSDVGLEDIKAKAEAMLAEDPELTVVRNVLVDTFAQMGDYYAALEVLEIGLEKNPRDFVMSQFKLRLLNQLGDEEGIGLHLMEMVKLFPDNDDLKLYLVRWYVSKDDIASADAFLREQFEGTDEIKPRVTYVQFKSEIEGPEAAIAAIDQFIANGENSDEFRMIRASSIYDLGRTDEAIAEMEQLIDGREPSDLKRDMQASLAQMLAGLGRVDEAEVLLDTVLAEDSRHVGALKLRANRLVEDDQVGDAVLALRTGLDQAPYDPDLYTLLAKAHEREGNRDLTGDNLALAMQHSRAGATESLRYARYLMTDQKFASARDVLLQALRRSPANIDLLRMLSEVYVGMADWPRTEQIVQLLRSMETEEARLLANGLEATLLQRMQRTDESLELLRGMLSDDSTALVAKAAIIRTHLSNGEAELARVFMDEALAENPDDVGTRFLNAALLSVEGEFDAAAEVYRDLLDENPEAEVIWRAYVASLARTGDLETALAALDEALGNLPDSMNLLWVKASYDEQIGDIDSAIAIYEDLYERQSGSTIVANNLASLISSHRTSEEDLQRAYVIARRLKGTEIAAFQDTYGWIAYRLGDNEEAITYLSQAAVGLPRDPLVQEHYAMALAEADRQDEARQSFEAALALLPADAAEARNRITAEMAKLSAADTVTDEEGPAEDAASTEAPSGEAEQPAGETVPKQQ